jgi:16S rRNA processing protein RimM
VEVLTDRPEDRFAAGRVLHVEGDAKPLTVAWARPVDDGPGWRLGFAEVPDRASAERLRDAYLEIAVDRAADLDAGTAYWHEVIGSTVRGSSGAVLGRVADVYRAGETEVYVVRDGPVGEFDVPAVRDIITTFAPQRGELVVDEAVLDLGSPAVDAPAAKAPGAPRRRHRWSRHGKGAKSAAPATPSGPEADPGPAGGGGNGDEPRGESGEGTASAEP